MQLLTIRSRDRGGPLAVKLAEGVLDVTAAVEVLGGGPGAPATGIMQLLQGGSGALATLHRYVDWAEPRARGAGVLRDESRLHFGPAVPHPPKIICVGLNYRQHAAEVKLAIPKVPPLFSKFHNAICAHGDSIVPPPDAQQLDYEGELTMVIGRTCKNVSRDEALQYVFGYCCANDFSARELQFATSQWLLGKTPDGFCPLGPYLVTADAVGNPQELALQTTVDGEVRQNLGTWDMIFPCDELISYISRYITLEPGDLILTGTPQGVALGYPDPKPWVRRGQTMTVNIDKLGSLTNPVG